MVFRVQFNMPAAGFDMQEFLFPKQCFLPVLHGVAAGCFFLFPNFKNAP
jgi:hypothetical protein